MRHHDEDSGGLLGPLLLGAATAVAAGLAVRAVVRARRSFELTGKVALVTGGSRGLGLEICRQLADAGCRVALCARDEDELREAREDLVSRGAADTFAAACDVTDAEDVRRFVGQVRDHFGGVDVLVNNAGVIAVGPFEGQGRDDFRRMFATHVSGPLEFIRAVLPDMRKRGGGRIVNVASVGGLQPVPHLSAYVASKHALVGLSQTIRGELLADNVYLTLVCPGTIRTGSPYNATFTGDVEAEYQWFTTGDNLRGASIDTGRMARQIVDAMIHGDAVLVSPTNAKLSAMFHGAFGGVSTELAGVAARFMPADGGTRTPIEGRHVGDDVLPGMIRREQQRNAAAYNQV